jgi:hypothetical protein
MSEIKVNKISQRSGTAITLGNSGTDFQLPSGADIVAQSGSTITIASGATITNSGTASGFGPTGAVSWDTTKKTSGFNAVSGVGYFCDTTSAAFTVTLPAAPSAGAIVGIADYNGTAITNNITVGRNSSNINGSAADFKISINYASISFVYVDATAGWRSVDTSDTLSVQNKFVSATGGTITTCGNFKIHTFTGPGSFIVSCAGNTLGSNEVDYLVVAGGGGTGNGGGGAGGYRTSFPGGTKISTPATTYPITVGGGGTASPGYTNGSPSIFSTITSAGGGYAGLSCTANGNPGGSGGGGSGLTNLTAGTGNTPPVSPPQGNNGGAGIVGTSGNRPGGGGGGAGAVGAAGTPGQGGPGGAGSANSITGSSVTYAGGGGGGTFSQAGTGGTGGVGGGGTGGSAGGAGTAGTVNTGGGGGGNSTAGGSGIVVIRYKFQ